MIFLTVGSALPFDRLVQIVDAANRLGLIEKPVFAQIGAGRYQPTSFDYADFLDHESYQSVLAQADTMISHAGMGSINASLESKKPLLVMPRRRCYGELVDDHQLHTADVFSRLGHLLTFETLEELKHQLRILPTFVPIPRSPNRGGIADEIQSFFDSLRDGITISARDI